MSLLRPFAAADLFKFNNVNLDHWTETYTTSFYLGYLAQWPDLSFLEESPSGRTMGYVIGKAEGKGKEHHGHVTAITVAPEYRRLGLAQGMMDLLEDVSDKVHEGWFVDLFVRPSNGVAVGMYESLGYSVFRRVREYYSGGGKDGADEDAFDMRKALSRDKKRETVRSNGRNFIVSPESIVF